MALTPKQKLFVAFYLKDKNATRAAKAAGFSHKTAEQAGSRLLSNVEVHTAVEVGLRKHLEKADLEAGDVIKELRRLAFVNVREAYDKDGKFLPIHKMPEDVQRAISNIEHDEVTNEVGEEVTTTHSTKKIKLNDKVRSLEILAKYFKLFSDAPPVTQVVNLVYNEKELEDAIGKAEDDV
jgi:phage terminase small subunit